MKHFLFDADGTLLPTKYADLTPLGITREQLQPFFMESFPPCVAWKADLKEVMQPYFKERWFTWTVDEILECRFSWQKDIREDMVAYAKELQWLWHKCYLCTQQETYRAAYMKQHMWFEEIFDGTFFTCDLWAGKKEALFWAKVREGLETPPKEDVFLLDDSASYCEAAADFGFVTHVFSDIEWLREDIQEYLAG